MTSNTFNASFFQFIQDSPTSFHAANTIASQLEHAGFTKLEESKPWNLHPKSGYFILRNNGGVIAFTTGESLSETFHKGIKILGAHTDSPSLQIKPKPDIKSMGYVTLGVEVYGGPILSTWMDRDLSIAGRVSWLDSQEVLHCSLVNSQEPCIYIPHVAIHLDREKNKGVELNSQIHLSPLFSLDNHGQKFSSWITDLLMKDTPNREISEILAFDLFCYDPQKPATLGVNNEFISCSRLDNLMSCYIGLRALIDSADSDNAAFVVFNDHEEVGSESRSGASGSFVKDIFERIYPDYEKRQIIKNQSLFISMDNAHAVHPNYTEKSDLNHPVTLNGGPVIKINSKLRYATDSHSNAHFKLLCKQADVPYQEFVMRSDMPCGSTIGPITSASLGIEAVDVGIPTFGMHSIREMTGAEDPFLLYTVIKHFISTTD